MRSCVWHFWPVWHVNVTARGVLIPRLLGNKFECRPSLYAPSCYKGSLAEGVRPMFFLENHNILRKVSSKGGPDGVHFVIGDQTASPQFSFLLGRLRS